MKDEAKLDTTSNAARNENMMRVGQNDADFADETAKAVLRAKQQSQKNTKPNN